MKAKAGFAERWRKLNESCPADGVVSMQFKGVSSPGIVGDERLKGESCGRSIGVWLVSW